jgi:hypothetical protein
MLSHAFLIAHSRFARLIESNASTDEEHCK